MTSGVLAALAYSHRAGIVHRDIKPANVMVTPTGDIKVMDFGIARAIADSSATMTQTQAVIGTAQYLSPEQARGETVDARSDLYSAGCLLFELLTAAPAVRRGLPGRRGLPARQRGGRSRRAPSRADVPPAVDAIVLHALEKDRGSRYQTADDFRADVDAALAGRRISNAALGSAAALGVRPPAPRWPPRRWAPCRRRPRRPCRRPCPRPTCCRTPGTRRRRTAPACGSCSACSAPRCSPSAVLVLPGMLGGDKTPPPPTKVSVPDLTVDDRRTRRPSRSRPRAWCSAPTRPQPSDTVPEGKVISQDPGAERPGRRRTPRSTW